MATLALFVILCNGLHSEFQGRGFISSSEFLQFVGWGVVTRQASLHSFNQPFGIDWALPVILSFFSHVFTTCKVSDMQRYSIFQIDRFVGGEEAEEVEVEEACTIWYCYNYN